MTELEEVAIEISDAVEEFREYGAVSNPQISYNIIERVLVETLQWQWTRSDVGITYNFSDYASPPLGRCELNWCWKGSPITRADIFVVVEKLKGTSCGIIIGPAGGQLPPVSSSNDIFAFTAYIRSKEEQQEQRERVQLAALRRTDEKAQDDARIRERRQKKKEEQQKAQRAKLA